MVDTTPVAERLETDAGVAGLRIVVFLLVLETRTGGLTAALRVLGVRTKV